MLIDRRAADWKPEGFNKYAWTAEWAGLNTEQIVRKTAIRGMRLLKKTNVVLLTNTEEWDDLMYHLDARNARDFVFDYIEGLGVISICVAGHKVNIYPSDHVEWGTIVVKNGL